MNATRQIALEELEAAAPTDAAAVTALLAANRDKFLRFLERRVGARETAEEILHDAYLRGIARAGSLRDGESATAWFYRLLRNTLVDHHRHASSEARARETAAAEPTPSAPRPDDDELYQAVCACIGDTLVSLKPEYAAAIRAVDLGEGELAAYAESAHITAQNAAVRLHRARQALRKRLEDMCGQCSAHGCLDCSCQSA